MSALMRQVLEHKRQRRRELAALPFPMKVKIVERMREAIAHINTSSAPVVRHPATPRNSWKGAS